MLKILAPFAAIALLTACAGVRPIVEGPAYPATVPLGPTLDIQVVRQGTEIELTNTTAEPFGPSTLWLNRWYGRAIDGLAPGEFVRYPLTDFKDRYGASFRAGGFFAIQRPERVAVAELATAGPEGAPILLPMVIVGGGQ